MLIRELFESYKNVLAYPVSDEDLAKMVVTRWLIEREGIDNLPGIKWALFLDSSYKNSIKWIDNEIKSRKDLKNKYEAQLSAIKILSARSKYDNSAKDARLLLLQQTLGSLKDISETISKNNISTEKNDK